MIPASRGFNRFSSQQSGQSKINSVGERFPINRTLMEVIKGLDGASTEMVERSKTIFFPGDPAERVYLIRRGAVRLSHQAIAEAIGSTRVTITRLLGDLKDSGLLNIERKKITVFDPIALSKRFN